MRACRGASTLCLMLIIFGAPSPIGSRAQRIIPPATDQFPSEEDEDHGDYEDEMQPNATTGKREVRLLLQNFLVCLFLSLMFRSTSRENDF